jgi:hypothetical protein
MDPSEVEKVKLIILNKITCRIWPENEKNKLRLVCGQDAEGR